MLPENAADIVCALDIFFMIINPKEFLAEIKRIIIDNEILIIDDGHQSRKKTKNNILKSGQFEIVEEIKDHLKYNIIKAL